MLSGGFARRPVHVRLQQLVLQIDAGPFAASSLHVTPRLLGAALAFRDRAVPLGGLELRLHVVQLALRERQLLALRNQFALQDAEALAVLRREALRDGDGLLVLDLAGEAATTLGIRKLLPLGGKLALGPCHRLLDLSDGDLGIDDGLSHLPRERPQVGGGRRIERGAERIPQTLEQGSALADSLGEKIGNDGLYRARLAFRTGGPLMGGVLGHRFRAREPRLTRCAAVLVEWHAETLFPRKTTVKLTHSQPGANWRMLKSAVLAVVIAACGGGLQPEPICAPSLVGLCGTVRFRGAIPDSTDNVFIAAYATFPQTCTDLINNRRPLIPGSVPYTDSLAAYSVALAPDTYHWVVAVWKKTGSLTLTAADTALLRVGGYYRDRADTTQPGIVTVPNGPAPGDIDILVDFDNLRPATDFVTCTAQ